MKMKRTEGIKEIVMAKTTVASVEDKQQKGSLASHPQAKRDATRVMNIIVGHVQGIQRMIEDERYCVDILKQIAAVQALLTKLATTISEAHMKHCVRLATEEGHGEEKIDELMEVFKYLRNA
jgi:DNA-binding FrmR family transcriptional regulator